MRIVRRAALSTMGALGFVMAMGVTAAPAQAQATRTWVSGVGDDANPCSRTAPCRTFQGTISKTAAGGEINCIDGGGFGAVTITKSITISCTGVEAGVLVAGTNGVIVNAGVNDRVVLRGLDFEGLSAAPTTPGINGVRVLSARDVVIEDCDIRAFGTAGVSIDTGTVKTRVTISDSRIIGNTLGVQVISTGGQGSVKVTNSMFANNTTASIRVSGAGNSAAIDGNAFFGSPKALELLSGGTATTAGNNAFGTVATDPATLTPLG